MKTAGPKIVVVGNCQARPVSHILGVRTEAQMLEPIVLHLATAAEENRHGAILESADLILAQYTASLFKPKHLASESIFNKHPQKTLVWTNLFYSGQQPFLRYLTSPEHGRILGPLDTYHDLRILRRWALLRGRSDVHEFNDADVLERARRASLDEIRQRESNCAVGVADLIESHRDQRRLFFTFNHPSLWLLEQTCKRICAAAELPYNETPEINQEPLARVVVSSTWQDWPGCELPLRGIAVSYAPDSKILLGQPRPYVAYELEAEFIKTYDHMSNVLDWSGVRYTPHY
jgi:hypothetical protein